MISQRAVQLSMRRLAAVNPSTLNRTSVLARLSAPSPVSVATSQHLQFRQAATAPTSSTAAISPSQGNEILAAQRLNRPVSPHLSIYQPQITWLPSIFNRITGGILSGAFYVFGFAYLVAPAFGWHLESATLAASFAALPILAKIGLKAFFALPFTFHSLNGLRHLVWDTGAAFTNKQVIVTGWTVIGASVVSAIGLTFL